MKDMSTSSLLVWDWYGIGMGLVWDRAMSAVATAQLRTDRISLLCVTPLPQRAIKRKN